MRARVSAFIAIPHSPLTVPPLTTEKEKNTRSLQISSIGQVRETGRAMTVRPQHDAHRSHEDINHLLVLTAQALSLVNERSSRVTILGSSDSHVSSAM